MIRTLILLPILLAACTIERAPAAPYAVTAREDGAGSAFITRGEDTIDTPYGRVPADLQYTRLVDLPQEELVALCEWTESVGIELAPLDVSESGTHVQTCYGWPEIPFFDECMDVAMTTTCPITLTAWIACVEELRDKAPQCNDEDVERPRCRD